MTDRIPPHGTPARYQGPRRHNRWQPCRNPCCKTAYRRAVKARELRSFRGFPGSVESAAVRAHVRGLLAQGWTRQQAATAGRVDRRTLYNILTGQVSTVRRDTARRLMTLAGPPPAPDGASLNAIGTARRIQALAAIGWTLAWTARQSGLTHTAVRDISSGRAKTVSGTTAANIASVYRRYAMTPGPHGIARTVAARNGWENALAWNDIDDPAERPYRRRAPRSTPQAA